MKRIPIFAALTVSFFAITAQAQQCELTDTVLACWMRFNPAAGTDVTQPTPTENATQQVVAAANTGISSFISPSGSAVQDFLSLLSASLESSSLSTNGQALTFDYNPPIQILGMDHALKLQAVFVEPPLNDQLTAHFSGNTAALEPFDKALTNTDDVAMSATFQPTSERWGRSIVPHRPMFRLMLNSLVPNRNQWLVALATAVANVPNLTSNQTFDSLSSDQQLSAMQAIETAAKSQQSFLRAVGGFAEKFALLLNNQPQLYATALYDVRKNVVGPNEWTAKFTYEIGANNLNAFRRRFGTVCNETSLASTATAAQCAHSLQTFAGSAATADDRLAISLEYHRTNQRWIKGDPNLGGFEFGYPRAHEFAFELTYGQTLRGTATSPNNGRIDLSFRYEDVRNPSDATKNVRSRAIGSITYTQKINDSFSFPVSLIYANHAANLGTVDKKLNTHFGLLYKLPK